MSFVHRVTRVLLALLIVAIPGIARASTERAQSDVVSYTSVTSGAVIETALPWYIDLKATVADDRAESIVVSTGLHGLVLAFLPPDSDPVLERDRFLAEAFGEFTNQVVVDRGAYDAVSYSLDLATVDGVRMGVFTLFLGQRPSGFMEVSFYVAPLSLFGVGITSLQENVRIDGMPALAGVDGSALQTLLNEADGDSGGLAPVTTPRGNGTPVPSASPAVEGRYISPRYGVEVTWGPQWTPPLPAVSPAPGTQDTLVDSILLQWTGGAPVLVAISIGEASGAGAESWVTAEALGVDSLEVLVEERSGRSYAAIVVIERDGVEMYAVAEVMCEDPACETLIGILLLGMPELLSAAYVHAQAGIAIDGVPVFSILSPDDVHQALER